MPITRRDFLKVGATAGALGVLPRPLLVHLGGQPEPVPPVEDPRLRALVERALDAAHVAGASYADVRLSYTRQRTFASGVSTREVLAVGVRALANGCWGFASSAVWSPDEVTRLGRTAVQQAKSTALGAPRVVELAPVPVVANGSWVMPVRIDPFEVPPAEILDFQDALVRFTTRTPGAAVGQLVFEFLCQEEAFGSTEGSYLTQRRWRTAGSLGIKLMKNGKGGGLNVDILTPTGAGWESLHDAPLEAAIRQTIAEIEDDLTLPVKAVDVGRYDTVVDARSVATLVDETLGRATELDRALGYEANAGGTSYITDPFAMVGTYQAGSPLLTLTGNRSEPGGCATVKWDDEGVEPDQVTLVQNGVLTDFQTTRESAGWLADYYRKTNKAVRSHGCAAAPSAIDAPLQHAPNIQFAPGSEALDFEALVAGLSSGIAVKGMQADMDFQGASGLGMGRIYEVKRGKRVARINAAGIPFRASELWKALAAVGGRASQRRYGLQTHKGEPAQEAYHSVTAPPALFRQLTLIDVLRKA
jgi:TldD protein